MTSENNGQTVESDTRAEWAPPAVKRMEAGEAENAAGSFNDDPVNYS